MSATISTSQFLFNNQYLDLLIKYFLSPAVVGGIFLYTLNRVYKLGELNHTLKSALKKLDTIADESGKHNKDLLIIKTHLITTTGLKAEVFGAMSPLTIKPRGQSILKKSKFDIHFNELKPEIIRQIRAKNPENIADVDEYSFYVLDKMRERKDFDQYKEVAFQNGITYDVLLKIFAIYVREKLGNEIISASSQ